MVLKVIFVGWYDRDGRTRDYVSILLKFYFFDRC